MPSDFIPSAARRLAAAIDTSEATDLAFSLVGPGVLGKGDVIVSPEPGDYGAVAVVAGDAVFHTFSGRPDEDAYVEVPVKGSPRPARLYGDTVTVYAPAAAES
ncbi:hypothetical protein CcI49_02880 [Frankia sp. CcI49]|uniref:hypothetical protein n=1 Tax=Frankia sp. CcI49 TaxID=1745382 RepID=UPI0009783F83|nr:hypothetical protein [Frankia sp. CcI49]ONH62339.1 hypothetical protein CcI49_02880 [Frankia sp. CcI49]